MTTAARLTPELGARKLADLASRTPVFAALSV
jgi:hypothetical protein